MASTAADASTATGSFRRLPIEVNRYETARTSFETISNRRPLTDPENVLCNPDGGSQTKDSAARPLPHAVE